MIVERREAMLRRRSRHAREPSACDGRSRPARAKSRDFAVISGMLDSPAPIWLTQARRAPLADDKRVDGAAEQAVALYRADAKEEPVSPDAFQGSHAAVRSFRR